MSTPALPSRPFPTSLCHGCAASRLVHGRSTLFLRCTALPEKYPPQPVVRCTAFREKAR